MCDEHNGFPADVFYVEKNRVEKKILYFIYEIESLKSSSSGFDKLEIYGLINIPLCYVCNIKVDSLERGPNNMKKLTVAALTVLGAIGSVVGASACNLKFFSKTQPGYQGETCVWNAKQKRYVHTATYRVKRIKYYYVRNSKTGKMVLTSSPYWASYTCTATHN